MAKNRKAKKQNVGSNLLARAERELMKGDAKAALKDAMLCYRQNASAAHRELLERAYVARVEQLHRKNQPVEARAVLARLQELKPSLPEVQQAIPRLRLLAGDASVNAAAVFAEQPALLVKLADDAVLNGSVQAPKFGGLPEQVAQVRNALVAVEQGEDGAISGLLAEIPRSSPLADWKLFVRGLSAFYAADQPRMLANWERLDPQRPAWRIAQTLRIGSGELDSANVSADLSGSLAKLERWREQSPAVEILKRLAASWCDYEGAGQFFRDLQTFVIRFGKEHPQILEQLTSAICQRAVADGSWMLLKLLQRTVPPLALDPNWTRTKALIAQNSDLDDLYVGRPDHDLDEFQDATTLWIRYADELRKNESLSPEERSIASGLVYQYLARINLNTAAMEDGLDGGMDDEPNDRMGKELLEEAAGFLRESIRRCPRLLKAYRELAAVHEGQEERHKAALVYQKLLQQDPDDFLAHQWLADYFLNEDDLERAERHVQALQRLKPRDPVTETLCWNLGVHSIRILAATKRFDEARARSVEASRNIPRGVRPWTPATLRAGVEYAAGDRDAGETFLQTALGLAPEPAPIWLQMSSTCARFKAPASVRKEFDAKFKNELKRQPTSVTAGALAESLASHRIWQFVYTGRATHEKLLIAYLKRATKLQWQASDLTHVCHFLELLKTNVRLRSQFTKLGLRQHPDEPYFHLLEGMEQPRSARAQFHFERVLELCAGETSPERLAMADKARYYLAQMDRFPGRISLSFRDFEETEEDEFHADDEDALSGLDFPLPQDFDLARMSPLEREYVLNSMETSMPPDIRATFKQMSAESGLSIRELIVKMLSGSQESPNRKAAAKR